MNKTIDNWESLSGQSDWEGLLDPFSNDLPRYIIHYGEMAQATYDAFDRDKNSKSAGDSLYTKEDFFSKVGLEKGHRFKYDVTEFLYATSDISDIPDAFLLKKLTNSDRTSNWIGYVAVATVEGRRDIVIAWRGTVNSLDWIKDLDFELVPAPKLFGSVDDPLPEVHKGWYSIYTSADPHSPFGRTTSARDQVLGEVRKQVEKYKNEGKISITITGHSLGAALATLNAIDIANELKSWLTLGDKTEISCPVTAIVFASPRVGDANFKMAFSACAPNLNVLRIRNRPDIVPRYPPFPVQYFVWFIPSIIKADHKYSDVGQELVIDTRKSNYLKCFGNWFTYHNLEGYLHGVSRVLVEVPRSYELLNKTMDGLKGRYHIPANWWRKENRAGMVQTEDGKWELVKDGQPSSSTKCHGSPQPNDPSSSVDPMDSTTNGATRDDN